MTRDVSRKSLFTDIVGTSPRMLILEFFLESRELDFSKSDVARVLKLANGTVRKHVDELVKFRVLISTRRVGSTNLYHMNKANKSAVLLRSLFDEQLRSRGFPEKIEPGSSVSNSFEVRA
jgi:hypothetical protein